MYKNILASMLWCCGCLLAAPVAAVEAVDATVRTPVGQAINVNLAGSVSSDAVVVNIITGPQHGALQTVTGLVIPYTPDANFIGEDGFEFQARDNVGNTSPTKKVTIYVGLVDLSLPVSAQTPAGAVSTTLERVCAQLVTTTPTDPASQALTTRCVEFTGATPAEKSHALQQLAPEEVAAQSTTATLIATQQVRSVGNRLAALRQGTQSVALPGFSFTDRVRNNLTPGDAPVALPSRLGFFISGTRSGGDRRATPQEDGFKHRTSGVTTGMDYRASGNFVYGGALGYATSQLDFAANGGDLKVGGYNMSLYGTFYSSAKSYLEAVLANNAQQFKTTRAIDYTLNSAHVQKTARGNSNSRLIALSLGGGYEAFTKGALTANLSARVNYLNSRMDSYRETGADELNLAIAAQKMTTMLSSLGGQMSYALSYRWGVLIPQLNASWEHEFKGDAVLIKGSFVADQTQTTFAFKGDSPDREFFLIGVGASAVLPGGNTSFVHYETMRGKANVSAYSVSAGLRLEL